MKVKKTNIYEIVYLLFAFDSALKFNLGNFRIQVGVLLALFLLMLGFVAKPERVKVWSFIKNNRSILPFLIYFFIHVLFSIKYRGTFLLFFYYLLGLFIFYFIYKNSNKITFSAIVYFQWILVVSGLFQYGLFKVFGIQIAFIDSEYYDSSLSSLAFRMRGFFLEPNWHGIILSFNSLLLFYKQNIWWKNNKLLCFLTILCIVFNGSYTFIGVVAISFVFVFFNNFPRISIKKMQLIILLSILVILLIGYRNLVKSENYRKKVDSSIVLNYGSRLFPIIKTTLFLNEQNLLKQFFGFGLGSWAEIGIPKNLGFKSSSWKRSEIHAAQRDSAEFQVFLLEFGWVGIILFLFDGVYLGLKFRKKNIIFFIAINFFIATFFVYPIYKFLMYMVPYYLLRSNVVRN